jgi:hypothetical protein
MDQNSAGFRYLKNKFPRISGAKNQRRVSAGPQMTGRIQDIKFENRVIEVEKSNVDIIKKMSLPVFRILFLS